MRSLVFAGLPRTPPLADSFLHRANPSTGYAIKTILFLFSNALCFSRTVPQERHGVCPLVQRQQTALFYPVLIPDLTIDQNAVSHDYENLGLSMHRNIS